MKKSPLIPSDYQPFPVGLGRINQLLIFSRQYKSRNRILDWFYLLFQMFNLLFRSKFHAVIMRTQTHFFCKNSGKVGKTINAYFQRNLADIEICFK